MDVRPLLFINGILLSILAASMVFPMMADLYAHNDDWKTFLLCIICTGFFGGALILSNRGEGFTLSIRQAFLLTASSWVVLATFGAFPLWLSGLDISFTDAFFESMSGITTTGSTILTGLDTMPPGILLWRGLLQWLGGVGIIVLAMSLLPMLKVGGMQLFRTENSESEKVLPRAAQLASSIAFIYIILTVTCAVLYTITGLSPFDSMIHAMTTLSTGGFGNYDASFAAFKNPWTSLVCIVFMIMGALPFVLYVKFMNGNFSSVLKDKQAQTFIALALISSIVMLIYLLINNTMSFKEGFLLSSFNVISVISGTGFVNGDYSAWGGFAVILFFFITVIGGCAGSASCGIKIFRFQILYSITMSQAKQLLHPHGVFIPHYNGKPVSQDVSTSVMSFFFLFAACFSVIAVLLSFIGLDFLTAMSGAATALANVGPGLGSTIGPAGNFAGLPDSAKWILAAAMLLGRLELFTVLIIFTPSFWKK